MELFSPSGKHWSNRVHVPVDAVLLREVLMCGEPSVTIRLLHASEAPYARRSVGYT
jgi:hypothetical protein